MEARSTGGRRLAAGVLAALAELVPERCVSCDGAVTRPADRPLAEPVAWCAACAGRVARLGERWCLDCPAGEARRSCRRPGHFRLLAGVSFGAETGALVRAAKYESCPERLAVWRDAWLESAASAGTVELLVPVPAHPTRVRERGFDVADAWARALGAAMGLPVARALVRRRHTPPQVGRDRERRAANVAGAFAAGAEASAVRGRRIAVVDDVVTTGATTRACAAVALASGAREVETWAFAYEPLE